MRNHKTYNSGGQANTKKVVYLKCLKPDKTKIITFFQNV